MSTPKYTKTAFQILKETSRTFYIPISKLPEGPLQQAIASAYLCLRAIDEIEDHKDLEKDVKVRILLEISDKFQQIDGNLKESEYQIEFGDEIDEIPEVSVRILEWLFLCPEQMRARVADATASMAERMSRWVLKNFKISTKNDLNQYTFAVAGTVGLLLSEMWEWAEGIITERKYAVGFGRGLQAVNILRNHLEDLERGVEFYPENWKDSDLIAYAKQNLELALEYIKSLPKTSGAYKFSIIPYSLAKGTLEVILLGKPKLTREEVIKICSQQHPVQLVESAQE